jgi:hypothetical protein
MYDFVYLSMRHFVRDSHWSRDYRDDTGIRVFFEIRGFTVDFKMMDILRASMLVVCGVTMIL